jgi:hypothetical protein
MARATSADGRWAYTLYNGGGGRRDDAFIHILDTVDGVSHCIELPTISGSAAWNVRLELPPGGRALDVIRGDRVLASMDTATYEVTEPPQGSAAASETDGGGISGTALGAIIAVVVLAPLAAFGFRRRRAGSLPPDPFGPGEPDFATADYPERESSVR